MNERICRLLVPALPYVPLFAAVLGWAGAVRAQSTINYAVQLYAQVSESPPGITLNWTADAGATGYEVYRRPLGGTAWGTAITNLPGTATSYADTNVVLGVGYEYWVRKAPYYGHGFLYGGIRMPLVENRGKLLLIVDNTYAADLSNELARLQLDLAGDGWTVLRHDVSGSDSVTNVKAIIKADYLADSNAVNSVFLFGHVPVPYSGNTAPDGHGDHVGAWGCDAFYADMDATWTDSTVSNSAAGRLRNVPGDGKYDYDLLPVPLELRVGRVDLANLPAFAQNERELLRQYLNKAHNFRHQYFVADKRGLVDDNFGTFYGEAFAACGWRDFSVFFNPTNVFAADFATALVNNRYLWAYGCGPGSYTSAGGVDTTAGLASGLRQAVFTMLFGSYHGDWDTTDNFMRAALASAPSILTCAWAGRPHWWHHHMGLGLPIGYSVLNVQNATGSPYYGAYRHVALMGDPTLRLLPVLPPADLTAALSGSDVALAWRPSPDAGILGYYVYRADAPTGYERVTATILTATNYTDSAARTGTVYYMVRAVKLEQTPSGSYSNLSQGVFNRLTLAGAANHPPVVTNRSVVTDEDVPVGIPLGAADSDSDPVWIGLRACPSNGRLTGPPTNYIYLSHTNYFGTDSFVYYAGDTLADGGTATVTITINPVNDAPVASNLTTVATNNRPAGIRLPAGDAEASPLTYTVATWPALGTLTGTPPDLVYTPTNRPYGTDTLTFTVFDGTVYGNTGTVSITIVDPPTAVPDFATTPEDTPVVVNVLTNDTDPNGDPLTVSAVTQPGSGVVTNQGTNIVYYPPLNYTGTASFVYTAGDGHSGTATAGVSVIVTPVNDPPTAYSQSVRILSDESNVVGLLAWDPESDPLSFPIASPPTNGVLTGTGSNVWYCPNPAFIGADGFTFRAYDGSLYGNIATVSITVVYAYPTAAVSRLDTGLDYKYYEGPFSNMPNTDLLTPLRQGVASNGLDVGLRARDTNIAFRFSGYLLVPQSGEYRFYVFAVHGLNVRVWDQALITYSNGTPGYSHTEQSPPIGLRAGFHPLTVTHFNDSQTTQPPQASLYLIDASYRWTPLTTASLYRVSQRPFAVCSPSVSTGGVPLAVTFDGSGSYDTNGTIVSYVWDFGDGHSATGAVVTHAYAVIGTYTVTLTVTDDDGGRDTVSAQIMVNYQPNALTYAEPFEDYPEGATMVGRRGWRYSPPESGRVTNLTYALPVPFPLAASPHTRVLGIEQGVTNEIVGGTNRVVFLDYAVWPRRWEGTPALPPDTQVAVIVNTNGHPLVFHGLPAAGTSVWSEVPAVTVGTADWIRVTMRLDYQTPDPTHSSRYCRIWINGTPLTSAAAYTTNNGSGVPGGPWFAMADASRPYLSALVFGGSGCADDLLATDVDPDGFTTNGTPVRWLMDTIGITNDYDALAATDSDGDSSPNWAERRAGTHPLLAGSVFRVIGEDRTGGTNWIVWYGTTNGGDATPFAVQRGTNLTESWELAVSNLTRSASGTNVWGDGAPPQGIPVFYRPLILP